MYIPPSFSEIDLTKLFDFIEQYNFGLVVSELDHEPFATHLPLLLDRQAGPFGTLIGHMARANPQWRAADRSVLVVFSGPHAYVSPSWYEAENVAPTWNYVAVHVYGTLRLVGNGDATLKILRDLVFLHEKTMPEPWGFRDGDEYVGRLAHSIVAFRVEITRIEGKWKLSQNHPRERREKVIDALAMQRDENSQAIAALMARTIREQE